MPTDDPVPPTCQMQDVAFRYDPSSSDRFQLSDLAVQAGEAVLLTGPSGTGKSTLLGLLCGVLAAESGRIHVDGQAMSGQSGSQRDRLRAEKIGYIFQNSNLVPYLSPTENVLLGGQFSKARRDKAGANAQARRDHATALLERFGITDIDRAAATLSVGQQQRVAAARAQFGAPPLLVADEPTAALDHVNRDLFFETVLSTVRAEQTGLLVVSHDLSIAHLFDRQIELTSIAKWGAA
ncbi:MAG: ATP-binding cassette domain-containing protein [Parvularculaceae bacterium]|nr:ATP-binding cassette domain-containing protein [Parvularculaceae bacterium]